MPLFLWVPVRVFRAFAATLRLVFDREAMRTMPWSYVRELPLSDVWIAIATVTSVVSLFSIPFVLLLPHAVAGAAYETGLWAAFAGIVAAGIRALANHHRLRR